MVTISSLREELNQGSRKTPVCRGRGQAECVTPEGVCNHSTLNFRSSSRRTRRPPRKSRACEQSSLPSRTSALSSLTSATTSRRLCAKQRSVEGARQWRHQGDGSVSLCTHFIFLCSCPLRVRRREATRPRPSSTSKP
jgi:hypothetical protein